MYSTTDVQETGVHSGWAGQVDVLLCVEMGGKATAPQQLEVLGTFRGTISGLPAEYRRG